jgi:ubiquinone/menaquinone biosynthesis C-methylase UbiE
MPITRRDLPGPPEQRMVGVDLSAKMLEIARKKCEAYPNVTFCTGSSSALPCSGHSFDLVVSASALHYFDQPEVSLGEMRRVLKPGGSIVIMDWCKDYWGLMIATAMHRRAYVSFDI